jgi:hypothetical protein
MEREQSVSAKLKTARPLSRLQRSSARSKPKKNGMARGMKSMDGA